MCLHLRKYFVEIRISRNWNRARRLEAKTTTNGVILFSKVVAIRRIVRRELYAIYSTRVTYNFYKCCGIRSLNRDFTLSTFLYPRFPPRRTSLQVFAFESFLELVASADFPGEKGRGGSFREADNDVPWIPSSRE